MADYPNYRRISDQATLLANIDLLVQKAPKFESGNQIYHNIVKLKSQPESGKDPEISVNRFYNFNKFIESAAKLTSGDMSFLIPYVKIYKIYPNREPELIPFNNFYPKNAIDAIVDKRSDRGFQANLTNVELVSQGKDVATTFLYSVKLKIVFDSIAALFKDDSIYLNLFNPPKKIAEGNINPNYYQIVLKFGWNTNPNQFAMASKINVKELAEFASLSKTTIVLHYIMHKININEDGSATLELEYNGALDSIARNANEINILADETINELQNLHKEIQDLEQSITKSGNKIDLEKDDKTDEVKEVKILDKDGAEVSGFDDAKKQLKQKHNQKNQKTNKGKEQFLNSLIEGIGYSYNEYMPALSINKAIYEEVSQVFQNNENPEIKVQRLNSAANAAVTHNQEHPAAEQRFINQQWTNVGSSGTTDIDFFNNLTIQENQFQNTEEKFKIPRYHIKYFAFGALIKAVKALSVDPKNFYKSAQPIIIGTDIQFARFSDGSTVDRDTLSKNPKYSIAVENGLRMDGNYYILKNEVININILDIPIALSTFKTWFLENITSQNLTNMTLIRFLDLCVNDLLKLALMPDNQDYIPKQNVKIKYLLDKVFFDASNNIDIIKNLKSGKINLSDLLLEPSETKDKNLKENLANNIIMFYGSPTHVTRKSDYKKDLLDGIPHFFYGNSNGNIKRITFREETIPHFKEANIQAQVDKTPWKPGIFLRNKYNVLLEMYGTVTYKMGSLIYISPSFTGMINKDQALEFGIGGYFVIVSIKHQIESGKFETIIEANWVATGDGKYNDLSHAPFQIFKVGAGFKTIAQENAEVKQTENSRQQRAEERKKELFGFSAQKQRGPNY